MLVQLSSMDILSKVLISAVVEYAGGSASVEQPVNTIDVRIPVTTGLSVSIT